MVMTLLLSGVKRRFGLWCSSCANTGAECRGDFFPASRRRRRLVDARSPTIVCRASVCPLTPFQIPGDDHGGGRESGNAEC